MTFEDELREAGHLSGRKARGAWVVFGGQAGSEGKGAIAGYLATKYKWGAAICTFMTNAGHTWMADDGSTVMVQQLPVALVNPYIPKLLIAPGAAITVERLIHEIEAYDTDFDVARRLMIHPNCVVITEEHRQIEREFLKDGIGSTAKGCGAALAGKVLRGTAPVTLARDVPELKRWLGDTTAYVNVILEAGEPVLVEAAQGFDLDINHGIEYPFCTSRGTTPMQVLADCGISYQFVTKTIAVVRSYPIRVGGNSGPMGGKELDWDEMSRRAGKQIEERTTVTKKVRRIFEPDLDRLAVMSQICRPTDIAYTFADYVAPEIEGAQTRDIFGPQSNGGALPERLSKAIHELTKAVKRRTFAPRVQYIKTGPRNGEIIDYTGPGDYDHLTPVEAAQADYGMA